MHLYKVILSFLVVTHPLQAAFFHKPLGWLWYEDPPVIVKQPEKKPSPSSSVSSQPLSASERLDAQKKAFDEAKALAILEPTLENLAALQRHHNLMMNQATAFQKSWSIAELLDPGYTAIPTSTGSLRIKEKEEKKKMTADLKELSQNFGLIFAFKPECPYCHEFAPLVKKFASQYGFTLQGLSKSDECFDGMTCSKNASALETVNPTLEFPMLYLVNPKTNDVIPIARGYISWDSLMMNIQSALTYLKNEGHF